MSEYFWIVWLIWIYHLVFNFGNGDKINSLEERIRQLENEDRTRINSK